MKSRSELWLRALEELGAQCSVDTTRDAETLARRVSREGEQFLTVTLPTFGKELERALAYNGIPSGLFKGWKRRRFEVDVTVDNGTQTLYSEKVADGVPEFLGGFLDLVFTGGASVRMTDFEDGNILEARPASLYPRVRSFETYWEMMKIADAIAAVRQLTLMFAKEKEPCSDARNEAAIRQYEETDQELVTPLAIVEPTSFSEEEGSTPFEG